MELPRTVLFLLISFACSLLPEAKTSMRRAPKSGDLKTLQVKQDATGKAQLAPEVKVSSKKFFEKDYPFDKRPKADPLHFNHPYPVVQDSSEYDSDFVKDENSDNGSWKAQETYDRLRAKLRKEKRDLAKALAKKNEEEDELKDAMKRHEQQQREKDNASKEVERIKREEEDKKKKTPIERILPGVKDPFKEPEPKPEPKPVEVSTEETEKAMQNLEECKKQLAAARQRLKDLMKELEDAKAAQTAANKALDDAMKRDLIEKEHHESLKKRVQSEYDDYAEARKAYEKQKAVVDQLEVQIAAAAGKVKAIRDSADADGGVYPTPTEHRSGAQASHFAWALVLSMMAWAASA